LGRGPRWGLIPGLSLKASTPGARRRCFPFRAVAPSLFFIRSHLKVLRSKRQTRAEVVYIRQCFNARELARTWNGGQGTARNGAQRKTHFSTWLSDHARFRTSSSTETGRAAPRMGRIARVQRQTRELRRIRLGDEETSSEVKWLASHCFYTIGQDRYINMANMASCFNGNLW